MASTAIVIIQAGIQLLSACLYAWVATIVLRRRVPREGQRANTLFGVWWVSLAIVFLGAPILNLLPRVFGYRDLALEISLLDVLLLMIVAAVWGLVYYLVYLYTGSARAFWPITAFYVALAFALLYLVAYLHPIGFNADGSIQYERASVARGPTVGVGIMFSLPVVIAALAYGSLYFRVHEPAPRYRIGLVAGGFVLQFGWSVTSSALQLPQRYPDSPVLPLVGNVLGIVAALAVLLAFRPPRPIRERLHMDVGGEA